MGFRFRKNFKIAPGIKLNLNKKSAGITFGTRGAHYTINSKGKKTASVGIPGTGLSYTTTSGGSSKSSSKRSNNKFNATTPNDTNSSNGQKWYQNSSYIILLLVFFFPVGLFLMWKYTNWNKYVKIGITAFFALALLIPSSSPDLKKITISADTTRSYNKNEDILIEYSTEPADYSLDKYDFEKTGGSIKEFDDKIYFSSWFTGTYEIYAEKDGVKSNVITITIEDDEEQIETIEDTTETTDDLNGQNVDSATVQSKTDIEENQEQKGTLTESNTDTQQEDENQSVSNNQTITENSSNTQSSSATDDEDPTVYITDTGDKYHRDGCRFLKKSKIAKKLSEIIDKEPCGICHPPTP